MIRKVVLPILMTAACSDPSLDIDISYENGDLAAKLTPKAGAASPLPVGISMSVSVVQADQEDGTPYTCDEFRFGKISQETLEGGRRASVSVTEGRHLTNIPRLGPKMIIVEARTAAGKRLAAGCTDHGDIDHDETVPVTVNTAPLMRVVAREPGGPPGPISVYLEASWDTGDDPPPALQGRRIEWSLETLAHQQPGDCTAVPAVHCQDTEADGTATIIPPDLDEPGPATVIVRAEWAEAPVAIPSFVPWDDMTWSTAPPSIDAPGRGDPHWVTNHRAGGTWIAAAPDTSGAGDRVARVEYRAGIAGAPGALAAMPSVAAPGVRAVVWWDDAFRVMLADGWHEVTDGGLVPPYQAGAGPGATSIVRFDPCGADGVLVLSGGSWQALAHPGVPSTDPALVDLATRFNGDKVLRVLDQRCIDATHTRVLAVRTRDSGVEAMMRPASGALEVIATPLATATTLVTKTSTNTGVSTTKTNVFAAESAITGPRITSYRLTEIGGTDQLIPSGAFDSELASTATRLVAVDLVAGDANRDALDILAALPGAGEGRVQVTSYRMMSIDQHLTGVTPPISGDDLSLSTEDVDGDDMLDVVTQTSETLQVFELHVPVP